MVRKDQGVKRAPNISRVTRKCAAKRKRAIPARQTSHSAKKRRPNRTSQQKEAAVGRGTPNACQVRFFLSISLSFSFPFAFLFSFLLTFNFLARLWQQLSLGQQWQPEIQPCLLFVWLPDCHLTSLEWQKHCLFIEIELVSNALHSWLGTSENCSRTVSKRSSLTEIVLIVVGDGGQRDGQQGTHD